MMADEALKFARRVNRLKRRGDRLRRAYALAASEGEADGLRAELQQIHTALAAAGHQAEVARQVLQTVEDPDGEVADLLQSLASAQTTARVVARA